MTEESDQSSDLGAGLAPEPAPAPATPPATSTPNTFPQTLHVRAAITLESDKEGEPTTKIETPKLVPPAWSKAADDVRTTLKWMVAALGGVGAVLFAKGLVTTPDLNWTDDRTNLLVAWFLGAAGLLGLGWLILEAVSVLRPSAIELGSLPPPYVTVINADAAFYLPADEASVASFIQRYQSLRRAEAQCRAETERLEDAVEAAKKLEHDDPAAVRAAESELEKAVVTYESVQDSLEVYVEVRQQLIDRASYWSAAQGLDSAGTRIVIAAFIAAVGGIGYQLALAPAGPAKSDEAAPSAPRIAQLQQTDTAAGRALWAQLKLADCQTDADVAIIDVVVSSGKGTAVDPYTVTTLPSGKCVARTFTVISDVATLSEVMPAPIITFTPAPIKAPETSPSPTGRQ